MPDTWLNTLVEVYMQSPNALYDLIGDLSLNIREPFIKMPGNGNSHAKLKKELLQ